MGISVAVFKNWRILFVVTLISYSGVFAQSPTRSEYEKYIKYHPYSSPEVKDPQLIKEMPKQDRPDLAWEQDFLLTMDPALGYPPTERVQTLSEGIQNMLNNPPPIAPGESVSNAWTERGPSNVGGRTRALMWDPDGSNKVWAGGVTGGLWYNPDITSAASKWVAVNDFWDNIAVTCIAYDPNNNNIMYVGTGEGFTANGPSSSRGAGVWRTLDGGNSWSQLDATKDDFYYVSDVVVRNNAGVSELYVGVLRRYDNNAFHGVQGLYRSLDSGASFAQVLPIATSAAHAPADLEISASGRIFVGTLANSFGNGGGKIFFSDDGTSWTLSDNLAGAGRVEIAASPSDPNTLYAIYEKNNVVENIRWCLDGGFTWIPDLNEPNDLDLGIPATDFSRGQAWYDLALAVDPNDSSVFISGAIDLFFHTSFGGSTIKHVSKWSNNANLNTLPVSLVHADQHAIVFKPGSSDTVIFGNDGGVYYTDDLSNATTSDVIEPRNNGYNVTQFYSGAIHPTSGANYFLAGAQDNGTQQLNTAGIDENPEEASGGDGGFCFIDQTDPTFQFTSYVYNNWYRSTNAGASFPGFISDNGSTGWFINKADYDDINDILYAAYNEDSILRLNNATGAVNIEFLPIALGGSSPASSINVSPYSTTDTTILFVGTVSGRIFKIVEANTATPTITDIDLGTTLPVASISCIEVGASDDELLVTFFNYGVNSVWYSDNGGVTWVDKEGDLPDMPVRWSLFNPLDRKEVILATEVGIWKTADISAGGVSWTPSTSGLANVRVDMLQLRASDNEVLAATHGRGLFTGKFDTASVCSSPSQPDLISGLDTTCENATTIGYSIDAVVGATRYNWTVPVGANIVGVDSTDSITVNFGTTSGDICVSAENSCGISSDTCISITLITVPNAPDTIYGIDTVASDSVGVVFITNVISGTANYNWTVPADATITSGQGDTSITVTFGDSSGTICVRSENTCGNSIYYCRSIYVDTTSPVCNIPSQPGLISGIDTTCENATNIGYSIDAVAGATRYNWTVPAGASIVGVDSTDSITVTLGTTSGDICVSAENSCGTSSDTCLSITLITSPNVPDTIYGIDTVASDSIGVIFTTNAISGATNYNWTVTADATITSGQGDTSITVTFGDSSGTICVRSENACGNSVYFCRDIYVDTTNPVCNVPAQPDLISGLDTICENATTIGYSIDAVVGATRYNWTVPVGANIVGVDSTDSITVNFGTTSGDICVSAENSCGISSDTCISITLITAPNVPDTIYGIDTVASDSVGVVFITNAISGAANYNWTVPADATITSGQGDTSITVTFGDLSGMICVRAENSCGNSVYYCKNIYVDTTSDPNLPPMPGQIAGDDSVCPGEAGVIYAIESISGVTRYNWTVPVGATIIGSDSSSSIVVDFGNTSGNVCVNTENAFGTSNNRCFAVYVGPDACEPPAIPGAITGDATICPNVTGVVYTINAVPEASRYNWTVPAGAAIIGSDSSTSIVVNFGNSSGNICVNAENLGGTSGDKCLAISVDPMFCGVAPDMPGIITGMDTICANTVANYSIADVDSADYYLWTVPVGATIVSGDSTTQVTVEFGNSSGMVCVSAGNDYGVSGQQCKPVVVRAGLTVLPPDTIYSPDSICLKETSVEFSVDSSTQVLGYIWQVPILSEIVSGQGSASISVNFGSVVDSICVQAQGACGLSPTKCILPNMLPYGQPEMPNDILGKRSVCVNESNVVYRSTEPSGAIDYNWTTVNSSVVFGQGTSEVEIDFGATDDSICVRAENVCGVSSYQCISVKVDNCTGIAISNIEHTIKISPNPTNGMAILSFESPINAGCRLVMQNVMGQEIYAESMNKMINLNSKYLDFTNLSKGIYFVEIQLDGYSVRRKVVYH